jgi:hypothetical protein
VADADAPRQALDVFYSKDVLDKAIPFFRVEAAVVGDDASRILSSMLNSQQPLVEVPENVCVSEDADYAAHFRFLLYY